VSAGAGSYAKTAVDRCIDEYERGGYAMSDDDDARDESAGTENPGIENQGDQTGTEESSSGGGDDE
jgi:hypothetical protein